jgi:trimeric autotransporter adhesin
MCLPFRVVRLLVLSAGALLAVQPSALAQRVALAMRTPSLGTEMRDTGALPGSTPLAVEVSLAATPERAAALDQFLTDVQTAGSPSYHKWLTPTQFATQFGATDGQIAAVTAWLQSQGLTVSGVSAGGTRLTVVGNAAAVESAFGVGLEQFQAGAHAYFANVSGASAPAAVASTVLAVHGLDNLPTADVVGGVLPGGAVAKLAVSQVAGAAGTTATPSDTLTAMAGAVDGNTVAVLTLTTADCSSKMAAADDAAYSAQFRQATAQGITVLATSGCGANGTGSFPASLAEVTAIVVPDATVGTSFVGIDTRPAWQAAPGLPAGTTRVEPDLSTPMAAFAQTIATIVQQTGTRQGNVNATLYALAPEVGLFTQADGAAAGTWEPATGLGQVDLTALVKAWPRGISTTQTALTFSSYSITHGQNLTLTASATDPANAGTPTGSIVFTSTQAGTLATVALVSGQASTSTNQLPGGQYNFTANYSGDGTYAASASNTGTVTVQPEPAAVSAVVTSGATFGGSMTVTVTVASTSGVGTPTGSVSAQPQISGGTTYSSALTSSGAANAPATATITFPVPQGGSFNLLVSCSGDASFSCYQPIVVPTTVLPDPTTTSITIAPTTPTTGLLFTLTAAVSNVGTTAPTGLVEFFDGTTPLTTFYLGNGTPTYSATFTTGKHSFTAVYSGDTNYAGSTSAPVAATGGTATTTTSLNSSIYGVTYGQPFTLTSTVQALTGGNGATPSGTITYTGATQGVLGTAPLVNGTASFTSTGALPVGTYVLTASYSGDANYSASSSTVSNILTISPTQGTVTATISPGTVAGGATATITAMVTLPYPGGTPDGTMTATVYGVMGAVYTAPVTAGTSTPVGVASIAVPGPATAGTYTVQVGCAGSKNYGCPSPVTVTLVSTGGGTGTGGTGTGGTGTGGTGGTGTGGTGGTGTGGTVATTTALAVSSTTPLAGGGVTLTATIMPSTAGTVTGTVTFYDNGTAVGTATVASGQAIAVLTFAAGAGQNLTATYSGDSTYASSTSGAVTVNVAATPAGTSTTALFPTTASALKSANVFFTAQVTGSSVAPTGTMAFYVTNSGVSGGASLPLGTATLTANSATTALAHFSTAALADGTSQIYAAYQGDANNAPSASGVATVTIYDYTVATNPTTLTITRGQQGTATLTVSAIGSFTGSVTFSCVAPAGTETTCSISPATVTGGSGTVTMTIGTTAAKTASAGEGIRRLWVTGSGVAVAMLLCFIGPVRRRRLPVLLLVLLAVAMTANLGCGSGASGTSVNAGSPAGATLFTIVTGGTDGVTSVAHDYQYQVALQ